MIKFCNVNKNFYKIIKTFSLTTTYKAMFQTVKHDFFYKNTVKKNLKSLFVNKVWGYSFYLIFFKTFYLEIK